MELEKLDWLQGIALLLRAADFIDQQQELLLEHGYATSAVTQQQQQQQRAVSSSQSYNSLLVQSRSRGPVRSRSRSRSTRTASSAVAAAADSTMGRSLHNQLEKTRRANLRHCLDRLREMIPANTAAAATAAAAAAAGSAAGSGPLVSLRSRQMLNQRRHKTTTLQLLKRARSHITRLESDYANHEQVKCELLRQQRELCAQLGVDWLPGGAVVMETTRHMTTLRAYSGSEDDSASSPLSVLSTTSDNDDVDIMGSASESDDYTLRFSV